MEKNDSHGHDTISDELLGQQCVTTVVERKGTENNCDMSINKKKSLVW